LGRSRECRAGIHHGGHRYGAHRAVGGVVRATPGAKWHARGGRRSARERQASVRPRIRARERGLARARDSAYAFPNRLPLQAFACPGCTTLGGARQARARRGDRRVRAVLSTSVGAPGPRRDVVSTTFAHGGSSRFVGGPMLVTRPNDTRV